MTNMAVLSTGRGPSLGSHLARLPAPQRHHDVAAADQLRSRHLGHDQRCLQGERRCHGALGWGDFLIGDVMGWKSGGFHQDGKHLGKL